MEAAVNGKAEAWRERVAGQRSSGLSIRAWCRQNGCPEPAFYWWRRRLGLGVKRGKQRRRRAKAIRFAEVVVQGSVAVEPIRLNLCNGRELILPAAMPVEQVAKLVKALEAAA